MAQEPKTRPKPVTPSTHAHGPGRYFVVWILLLIFTATTVITGRMDLGDYNIVLALVIATIKATLVVLFFMHMTEAAGANRLVFVVSMVFIAGHDDRRLRRPVDAQPDDAPAGNPPPIQAE